MRTQQGGERHDVRPPGPPRGRRTWFLVAAVVVVVAAVAAVAVFVLGGDDGGDKAKATASGNGRQVVPTIYSAEAANPGTARLGRRAKDDRPLTQDEVFTPNNKTVSYKQWSFTRAAAQVSNDCQTASWGKRIQTELKTYGCTQIVRGAYVSNDKKYLGQFIALNMDRQQGADQLARSLDAGKAAGFLYPLAAPGMENFGNGTSAAYAQVYGHFTVLSWVQRVDGGQPTVNDLINASLAVGRPGDFVWGRLERVSGTRP